MSAPRRARVFWGLCPGLGLALGLALSPGATPPLPAAAQEAVSVSHGLSAFGDLAYGPDFAHFAWVNPQAPKGGEIRTIGTQAQRTFDSLNGFILKGDPAQGLALLFDSLMVRAWDEPDALYGLVASHVHLPHGRQWVGFDLRAQARFADGSPLRAEDVVFSFEALKAHGAPRYALPLADVAYAIAVDPLHVRFVFREGANRRDLPLLAASLPIFSKEWYATRAFSLPSMEPPLGSGPYVVEAATPGRTIRYARNDRYWARDLPVNVGRYNFGHIVFEYFRDDTAAFEAFKAGGLDLREEFVSRIWATQYDFPALRDGLVLRESLPDGRPSGTQGYWFNTRRALLSDRKVREALAMVFDFEWSNRTLFHGLYARTDSFFEGSPMEARGVPSQEESALLAPWRDRLSPSVFGTAFTPPVTDGTGRNRAQLRKAGKLLDEAGWRLTDGLRRNAEGTVLAIAFIDDSPAFERITAPYMKNLERLGVQVSARTLDPASYLRRMESFDFDMTVARFSMSPTPGVELRAFFSARSAGSPGSYNLAGVADPVVDALIEAVIGARTRAELAVSVSALDRVLRASHIWVPHWNKRTHTLAWWDKFGRPKTKPPYSRAILDSWWVDKEKERFLRTRTSR